LKEILRHGCQFDLAASKLTESMGKTLSFAERLNAATVGQIAIEGMQFYAHHGFYKEEQVIGGQYEVDVYMNTDIEGAATTDRLEMTVNYERVYGIVKEVMTNNRS
jgi:hypothetical protein